MSEEHKRINYDLAKAEADKVDEQKKNGPQFGFFGDAWQTIYQSNKACGLIENENLKIIKRS